MNARERKIYESRRGHQVRMGIVFLALGAFVALGQTLPGSPAGDLFGDFSIGFILVSGAMMLLGAVRGVP